MTDVFRSPAGDDEIMGWLNVPMNFAQRPDPVSPDFRPERRIAVCLLIVEKSHSSKASWKAMHVLSWALQSPKRIQMLSNVKSGNDLFDLPVVRFEPALDRALDLALGLRFLTRIGSGPFGLTAGGQEALAEIHEAGILQREVGALAAVSGKISNKDIERLLEWRS